MCGIAGYYGSKQLSKAMIGNCLKLMHRRGPDYADYYQQTTSKNHNIYLLHSRLSIIDQKQRSHQPAKYSSQVFIYNGELYNYVEIKQLLLDQGETFSTESDTEVFLRAIVKEGLLALDRCEGMWAFALYDEKQETLTLCRDRFGEKPLYIFHDDTGIYFGSEIKFIQELYGRSLTVNYNHLYRYIVNGYKSLYKNKEHFFRGIEQVEASGIVTINNQGRKIHQKYWSPQFSPIETMTYEEALENVTEFMTRAVKIRLRADVPIAFCMSGGVDSNALISIAKNICNYNVHGFTIVNTDERYEEQELVDYAVKELKIKHTPLTIETKDFLPKLTALVRQHDAPVYTITYFAHWQLMEKIAEHGYRISVSGTGADEIFTGYYDHHLAYLYDIRDHKLYDSSVAAWQKHIRPIVRNPFLQSHDAFIKCPQMRSHIYLDAENFATYLRYPWKEPFSENHYTNSLLRNRMANEIFHESVPVILHEDDLNAMYYSIENRSPFLDSKLFEFCATIPTHHLVQDGCAKALLRQSMRGIAPQRIIENRRKVGFNAPIFSYLDIKDPQIKDYLLDQSPIFDHIHRNKIEALLAKETLPNSQSKFLFYFLNSKIFLEQFS